MHTQLRIMSFSMTAQGEACHSFWSAGVQATTAPLLVTISVAGNW